MSGYTKTEGWDRAGWNAAFKKETHSGPAHCHEDRKHYKGGWCEECYDRRVTFGSGWKTCPECKVRYVPSMTSVPHKCGICAPLKRASQ